MDVPTDATDGCTPSVTVDGCGFSKRRAEQQVYAPTPIARGGGSTTSPYLFEPIPGIIHEQFTLPTVFAQPAPDVFYIIIFER